MEKLLIVDGHNLLFQMFFGMPARIYNKNKEPVWGVIGFVGALLKMIRMTSPKEVVVLFDGEHKNDRKDLDADYKANRIDYSKVPDEENPFSQLAPIFRALDLLGIKHVEIEDYETDDAIAAYVLKYGEEREIVISSFDSDFFQLITKNVKILRYRGDSTVVCDEAYVLEKVGVPPRLYADFKSLVGDKADNIKGVDKIGAKTAAQLLNEYGSLNAVLDNCDLIKKPSIKTSLKENKSRALLNKELITLSKRAEIPFLVNELVYEDKGLSTNQVLKEIGAL